MTPNNLHDVEKLASFTNPLVARKTMLHDLRSRKISGASATETEETRRIREWLFGILRFAITLERCDRAAVMSLAAEMDRLGASKTQSAFSYFTRTTTKLCDCIVAKRNFDSLAELWLHLEKIDDSRLRCALEGALFEKSSESARRKKSDREYLWKGLAVRQSLF